MNGSSAVESVKDAAVKAPFGAANRQRLIDQSCLAGTSELWLAVYRLLLWTDKTTGLAHCYESDKCQPGKPWYQRNLRFHDWLSGRMAVPPGGVADQLDLLFRRTADDYARWSVQQYQRLLRRAVVQRTPFEGRGFPEPGEDPAIIDIIRDVLGSKLTGEPSASEWRSLTRRIRELIAVENKRKNLLGEGFEDVLAAVVRGAVAAGSVQVIQRCVLQAIPGFGALRAGDKQNKVDLALLRESDQHRTLVTAKWSIRADREKQFSAEFASYVTARSDLRPFDYVLLTNEFDPARLERACAAPTSNAYMFSQVDHISTDAVKAVYGDGSEATMAKVLRFIEDGRLISLDEWVSKLVSSPSRVA